MSRYDYAIEKDYPSPYYTVEQIRRIRRDLFDAYDRGGIRGDGDSVGLFQQIPVTFHATVDTNPNNEERKMTSTNHENDKDLARAKVAAAEAELQRADRKQDRAIQRRDEAMERLRQARAELAKLDWPKEPLGGSPLTGESYPPLVTFTRRLNTRTYTHAAIGIGGRWCITGSGDESKSWTELMEFAGETGRRTLRAVTRTNLIGR